MEYLTSNLRLEAYQATATCLPLCAYYLVTIFTGNLSMAARPAPPQSPRLCRPAMKLALSAPAVLPHGLTFLSAPSATLPPQKEDNPTTWSGASYSSFFSRCPNNAALSAWTVSLPGLSTCTTPCPHPLICGLNCGRREGRMKRPAHRPSPSFVVSRGTRCVCFYLSPHAVNRPDRSAKWGAPTPRGSRGSKPR
jgi:hypothetical protein